MTPKRNRVSLDADHQGHLACVICNYLNHIRLNLEEYLESDDTDSRLSKPLELMETFYMAGNIEGRILSNNVDMKDIELVEAWEAELEEEDDEDITLHVIVNLPHSHISKIPEINRRIRREWKKIRPLTHIGLTWLTEDPEEYDSIQLNIEILVSPEHHGQMTTDILTTLHRINLPTADHWTEK